MQVGAGCLFQLVPQAEVTVAGAVARVTRRRRARPGDALDECLAPFVHDDDPPIMMTVVEGISSRTTRG